jgi:hypothetical protein
VADIRSAISAIPSSPRWRAWLKIAVITRLSDIEDRVCLYGMPKRGAEIREKFSAAQMGAGYD